MWLTDYQKTIVDYYASTENSYKDAWDLTNSLSIHYGYWDKKVRTFPQSLARMNEVMMQAAGINSSDRVLDAGCGVGGSSIFLAETLGCKVTGITLSQRQKDQAIVNAKQKGVEGLIDFKVMDYCSTEFPDATFDVVWGCESICYAKDKFLFVKEAFRLLKPGGRLVVADGFVSKSEYNERFIIKKWKEGWQVDNLISKFRFENLQLLAGFTNIEYRDISKNVAHSSRRLLKYFFMAKLYLLWKSLTFSNNATSMQKKNINACWYQYWGLKFNLWRYGLFVGKKQ